MYTLARAQITLAFSGPTLKSAEISVQLFSPYQWRVRIAARLRRGISLSCEAILSTVSMIRAENWSWERLAMGEVQVIDYTELGRLVREISVSGDLDLNDILLHYITEPG